MKTQLFDNTTTRNLLQYCYTCTDAHACTTEEICRECWAADPRTEENEETDEIRDMINEYYA
jgi:hypothetical protein